MNYQERVLTKPRPVGKIIVLYGPPGVGKTTFAAQAPDSIVIQVKDHSLDVLMDTGILSDIPNISAKDWDDALNVINWLTTDKHGYRVVIVDGLSGLEAMCDEKTVDTDYKSQMEKFLAFGNGYKLSADRWCDFLNKIDRLKDTGVTVILLAHKGLSEIKNASGNNYYKFMPGLHVTKFTPTNQYCDAILRMDFTMDVRDVNELTGKGKAVGNNRRFLFCEGEASFEAKNRLNLPPLIDLGKNHVEGWDRFCTALLAGKNKD